MCEKNYYEILGVGAQADGAAIQRSYWQLARKFQALAPSDPRARVMLDDLNEAYAVLGSPQLRQEYDGGGRAGAPAGTRQRRSRGINIPNIAAWRRTLRSRPEAVATPSIEAAEAPVASAPRPARRTTVDDLRLSTASIVGRMRQTAAPDVLKETPDTTLVDIFQSEKDIEEPAEPLSAVLDVLRGSREPANSR
jgi:curved DNA-binding protein CbpA